MKRVAALVLLGSLLACSAEVPTTIDGTSPETFAKTTAAARRNLPVADRLAFDSAIAGMPSRRYANQDPAATARAAFDGLTAAEVVDSERKRLTGR